MFSPEPMLRLSALVLQRDERHVLRALGRLGAVQLTRTPAGEDTAPLTAADRSGELARCERLLSRVEELRCALGMAVLAAPLSHAEESLEETERKLHSIEQRAHSLLESRQSLEERSARLGKLSEHVAPYRGLEIPLDRVGSFEFLHFVTGTLPAENLESLKVGPDVALLPLPTGGESQPLLAITTRQGRAALEQALAQAGFRHEPLPSVQGETADTFAERSQHEQEESEKELQRLHTELQKLGAENAPGLSEIAQRLQTEHQLLSAEQCFSRTEATVLISGWIPASASAALTQCVMEITAGRCAIETAPPGDVPEEQIPVLLRHSPLLRPFEMLIATYGLPRYRELAPTLFVAISFVLMFGMMFGDIGHGGILALAGLGAWMAGRSRRLRDLGFLLLCGGLSSIGFGAVYGSCFGLEQMKRFALWHDPLAGNPMGLMTAAMSVGVVMISLGLLLNVINHFRRGDFLGGLLDKFGVGGIVFYWGALALVAKAGAIQARGLQTWVVILFLVLPIVAWTLKEPVEYLLRRRAGHALEPDGLITAMTESVVGAFEGVLSYLANTISFVRLAAYAMSHAALLMAAFMMAAEVGKLPVGGGALSVAVIVLGNVVAIVLEGIVATVQTLRLEYYEFFGKFFAGSGQPFQPFRLVSEGGG